MKNMNPYGRGYAFMGVFGSFNSCEAMSGQSWLFNYRFLKSPPRGGGGLLTRQMSISMRISGMTWEKWIRQMKLLP